MKTNYPPILDACCGGRMFWFDKHNPNALFQDIREVPPTDFYQGRIFEVNPDVVADFTNMPYPDDTFRMVVFDPPHLPRPAKTGKLGYMHLKYGHLEPDWKDTLRKGFSECFRVLKKQGFLIFKWSEANISVSEVLPLAPMQPLFGHRTGKSGKTLWICFMKLDTDNGKD